jgi:Tfp pilus assembly protein PilF
MGPPSSEIRNALSQAFEHHRAGRWDQAIAGYRQVIELAPGSAELHNNLGMALRQRGRLDEAISEYEAAIRIKPDLAEAFNNLGIAFKDKGELDQAIGAYRQAVAIKSDIPGVWHNLGFALVHKKDLDAAIEAFSRAVALDPQLIDSQNNLGGALLEKKQFDKAVEALRRAVALNPKFLSAQSNLGKALLGQGNFDEAVACQRRALELAPQSADAQCDLAFALSEQGNGPEAADLCRQVIAQLSNHHRAYNALGTTMGKMHQHDQAIAAYRRAIEVWPDYADAHWNLASELLITGDYAQGWEEHEWWRQVPSIAPTQSFTEPEWDGGDLNGKTILLHIEQGFGDSIQFIRYLPLVAQRGGRVIVQCQSSLHRLFSKLPDADKLIVRGQPIPAFDVQCLIMSLPRIFGTRLDSIPGPVPYLRPDDALQQAWRDRLGLAEGLRVGLLWGGRSRPDPRRSAKLEELAPLADVKGVNYLSLQVGSPRNQLKEPPPGLIVRDMMDQAVDFAETAALIANLDLVISIDSAMAHLAGAMGKPVWVMLPYVASWRWLLDRGDSPWYPTARLFRQTSPGDWPGVAARVAQALQEWRPATALGPGV